MPGYFSKHAGPRLKDALRRAAELNPDERLSLLEELDLSRVVTAKALANYERIVLNPALDEKAKENVDQAQRIAAMRIAATQQIRSAIEYVTDCAVKAAKVRKDVEAVVDIEQLDYIAVQVQRIIDDECPEVIAKRVADRMKEIRLPQRRSKNAEANAADIRAALLEMESAAGGGVTFKPPDASSD